MIGVGGNRFKKNKKLHRYHERVLGKSLEFTDHALDRANERNVSVNEIVTSIRNGKMYFLGQDRFVVSFDVYKVIVVESRHRFRVVSVMFHSDFQNSIRLYVKRYRVGKYEAILSLKRNCDGKFSGGERRKLVGMSVSDFVTETYVKNGNGVLCK